ncbi:MAG: hypothetical protein KAH54_02880 [Candidatus Sabulitectum sp.]|nr:hypothetical protein [Candidatus Sabulitectum sp.]
MRIKALLFMASVLLVAVTGCTETRVVQSRYVIQTEDSTPRCTYTWQHGDYWEFLAWALLDDVSSSDVLAITAGYAPENLPSPGTEIIIPIPDEYEEAARERMEAARLVRTATEARASDPTDCMRLLREANDKDPSWSVPVTNITVLLLEDGRIDEALELLDPMCHKNTPALILAGIAWRHGDTEGTLRHLSEALITPSPRPEVLAAAGIVWSVTGERERAGNIIRRLLEDPEAPSELRILALQYALMLAED